MDKKKIKYQKTNLCLNTNRLKIHLTYAYQMDLCVVTHPDKGHKNCIFGTRWKVYTWNDKSILP